MLDQSALDADEEEDMFGWSLAAGDFTNDGLTDLVVGAPGEMPGGDPRSGAIRLDWDRRDGLLRRDQIGRALLRLTARATTADRRTPSR